MAEKPPKTPDRRRALSPEAEREVVDAFVAGESQARLAAKHGCAYSTIQRVLARAGVSAASRAETATAKPRPDFREAFEDLGDPPLDPVLASEWLHRNLMLAARQTATDPAFDARPQERTRVLVQIARAAGPVLPAATLARTKRLIAADAAERDGAHRGPTLEPPPPDRPAARGRPRRQG